MKTIRVYQYDAFSQQAGKGNPAGVVLDETLTEQEMQTVAYQVGFNETGFSIPSALADLRIRYFTPGHEMNLCGHGTVATLFALHTQGRLPLKEMLTIETKAGILPVQVRSTSEGGLTITMEQAAPQFQPFQGSRIALADALGLAPDELSTELPIVYGSTGIWTLIVPINSLDSFSKMKPHNQRFPALLEAFPKALVHPICLQTFDPAADMHGRHFSSPFSGIVEDPVTGTASGVMGAYYAQYIKKGIGDKWDLLIEQGQEIDKDGRVYVTVEKHGEQYSVQISGTAVYVREITLSI